MAADRCQICRRIDDAFVLLQGISHRGRIAEDEKLPAWRAIKQLYRAGVSRDLCYGMVLTIQSQGRGCGPTLLYYLREARGRIDELRRNQP